MKRTASHFRHSLPAGRDNRAPRASCAGRAPGTRTSALFLSLFAAAALFAVGQARGDDRPRVVVSTDAGGTDYDDFQSLVHLFVYADRFDLEGLVSSPMGALGRTEYILKVIDVYERDYPNLRTHSDRYPTPEHLRSITKQGTIEAANLDGFARPTEGSEWIVRCAKRPDERPLWLLMWGGLEDLAQALHDEPAIKSRIRVYFIGGPNKKWSAKAYDYIARNHADLWMIEANTTYYGWFDGGNQKGDLGNESFVKEHLRGRGAMGDFLSTGVRFNSEIRSELKMGDTPSVAYVLGKTPDDPTTDSWGGRFVRAWDRRRYVFDRAPTAADHVEACAIVEILYRLPTPSPPGAKASIEILKQKWEGFPDDAGVWHFIYSPKEPERLSYTIRSTDPRLDGKTGSFTAVLPAPNQPASARYPNWWTDDPDPAQAEGTRQGAKTINRWREDYLRDFGERMKRCQSPAGSRR